MNETALILAVTPVVLGLSLVEGLIGRALGKSVYRFADTVNDLLQAAGHLVVGAFTRVGPLVAFGFLQQRLPWGTLPADHPATWVLTFVLVDLVFWLRHYALHRVSIMWAVHEVHHQPHQLNYTVAQRIGWFQDFTEWPFTALLAFVGLPAPVVIACLGLNHLYQFFLHTELVPRLRWLEPVLMTPSGHRVHHSSNPQYIDKNFGGVFSIWDHLFGTWEPEVERPVYGTVAAMKTWDPLENNVAPLRREWRRLRAARGLRARLHVVFGPPGTEPGQRLAVLKTPEVRVAPAQAGLDAAGGRRRAAVGLALAVVLTMGFLVAAEHVGLVSRIVVGVALLWGLRAVGRGMGGQRIPETVRQAA